jgi:hypothetical protein
LGICEIKDDRHSGIDIGNQQQNSVVWSKTMRSRKSKLPQAVGTEPLQFHFCRTGDAPGKTFLHRSYEITCNGAQDTVDLSLGGKETSQILTQVLEIFSQGRLTLAGAEWLAQLLRRCIAGKKGALESKITQAFRRGIVGIELSAKRDSVSLLTNIPWEITALVANSSSNGRPELRRFFAQYPVTRLIQGKPPESMPQGRLRVYYCIANPSHRDVDLFKGEEFRNGLETIFRQLPMIDAKASQMEMGDPSARLALQEISEFRPHIFIFIGHGDSSQKKSTRPQLLFEKWIDLEEIAQGLLKAGSALLAMLICCDMTRRNDAIGSWSGAHRLAQMGVPGIVAMQGDVEPDFAQVFTEQLIVNLLKGVPVSRAVSKSRDAGSHRRTEMLQAFLPAVFTNENAPPDLIRETLRDYRDAMAGLSQELSDPRIYLKRPALEEHIAQLFHERGLRIIAGGYGYGKTSLISRVIRGRRTGSNKVPVRPVFYLGCDQPNFSSASPDPLFQLIGQALDKAAALLSQKDPIDEKGDLLTAASPGSFFTTLDRKNVIVVVDNFRFPKNKEQRDLWGKVFRAAAMMKETLLILSASVPGQILADVPPADMVRVAPFSLDETRAFLEQFVPSYAMMARHHSGLDRRIYRRTGGIPQFLNLIRLNAQETSPSLGSMVPRGLLSGHVADAYLRKIAPLLSKEEINCLFRLCWLSKMTSFELAREYLDPSAQKNAVRALERMGIAKITMLDGAEFCYVPTAIRQAVRHSMPLQLKQAASWITVQFESYLPEDDNEIGKFFRYIARRAGGLALLDCVQRAYIATGEAPKAAAIATLADSSRLDNRAIYALYHSVLENARPKDPTFYLRAAELAQLVGHQSETLSILKRIVNRAGPSVHNKNSGAALTPYYRVQYLKILATIMKDTKQHAAIPQLRRIYEKAIPLAKKGVAGKLVDKEASEENWKSLLSDLLHGRLTVRAFLDHSPMKMIMADLEELKQLMGHRPEFADELCLVAEYELKAPDKQIDWSGVAGKLLEAQELLEGSGLDRSLAQCLYFYGEYLRRKPRPRLKEARDAYRESEKAASRAGEARRVGRARRKWVELEWRLLRALKAEKACALLEEAIHPLRGSTNDALTLRVLERLYTLRAEIGSEVPHDATDKFLLRACQAGAAPVLQAKSDQERFGKALRRYLDALEQEQNFRGAQAFLERYMRAIQQKLGLTPDLDDPWKFAAIARKKYPEDSRRYAYGTKRKRNSYKRPAR